MARGGAGRQGLDLVLVDDDSGVREVAASCCAGLGYEVHEAGSGGAALEMLDCLGKVDLILIDFAMPGMNGSELARSVHAKRPDVPILLSPDMPISTALAELGQESPHSKTIPRQRAESQGARRAR